MCGDCGERGVPSESTDAGTVIGPDASDSSETSWAEVLRSPTVDECFVRRRLDFPRSHLKSMSQGFPRSHGDS